jgi:hypothetical protein
MNSAPNLFSCLSSQALAYVQRRSQHATLLQPTIPQAASASATAEQRFAQLDKSGIRTLASAWPVQHALMRNSPLKHERTFMTTDPRQPQHGPTSNAHLQTQRSKDFTSRSLFAQNRIFLVEEPPCSEFSAFRFRDDFLRVF